MPILDFTKRYSNSKLKQYMNMTPYKGKIIVTPALVSESAIWVSRFAEKAKEVSDESGKEQSSKTEKLEWATATESVIDSITMSDIITFFLSKVSEVKEIYIIKESDSKYHIWSVIPKKTAEIKKKIYQQEKTLIKYFKENMFFDFHIIEMSDREYLKSEEPRLIFGR